MYKIQVLLISLFISSQAFSFIRVFECQEKANQDKIQIDGVVRQNGQGRWANLQFDLRVSEDGKTVFDRLLFIYPRRVVRGFFELRFWGGADLVLDTFPQDPTRLLFGRWYDARLRVPGFNDNAWYDRVECQYVGF